MPALTSDTVTGLPRRSGINAGTGTTTTTIPDPFGVPHRVTAPTVSDPFGVPHVNTAPAPSLSSVPQLTPAPPAPAAPDYASIITNDPIYQQTQADIAAARASNQATLDAQRQRALIEFGGIPDLTGAGSLVGDLSGSITDPIRQLAQANTTAGLSTQARINKAHEDAVKAAKDNLTARGLLSSGETGYQLGQQETSYQQAQHDAIQKLLDYLSGIQGDFLSAEAQRRATLAQSASDAAGRIPPTTAATAGGTSGGGGSTINLTPAQQQQVANNQFPELSFPTAPPASSITPVGNITLNPGQQQQIADNQFPAIDFGDMTPADYPPMTFPEAPPASDITPVGTVPLTPAQQQQIANNQYPILNFPPVLSPVGVPRTPGTSGARPLY